MSKLIPVLCALFIFVLPSCDELEAILPEELTAEEVARGLKEALEVGSDSTTTQLSRVNGYFQDEAIKILLPDTLQAVRDQLQPITSNVFVKPLLTSLGFDPVAELDGLTLKLNQAAEGAAGVALEIFITAITNLTIQDAFAILEGDDQAATTFLRNQTETQLREKYLPVVDSTLKTVDALQAYEKIQSDYNTLVNQANALPGVELDKYTISLNLQEYAAQKALDGLFFYIGEEERKIRTDPAARVTEILKKVFGAQN